MFIFPFTNKFILLNWEFTFAKTRQLMSLYETANSNPTPTIMIPVNLFSF